jgi:hypothetical protein
MTNRLRELRASRGGPRLTMAISLALFHYWRFRDGGSIASEREVSSVEGPATAEPCRPVFELSTRRIARLLDPRITEYSLE